MITPRYYQEETVNAIFDYWSNGGGNPLADLATGTGKSMCLAMLFKRLVTEWADMRVMCATHVIELVESNYKELLNIFPFAPAGIYAASLNQRNARAQILFVQIQTVHNKAKEIGWVDVLAIDEVHLVPDNQNTMYRAFINALLEINPDMRVVGFSATLFRLDSGRLDEGENRLFDKTVYEYGIRRGIDDGYLTPITSKPTETIQDTSHVSLRGYDLAKKELQDAVDHDWLNRRIIEEVMDKESHRRTALFFCAGVEHSRHVCEEIRRAGRTCEVVLGNTDNAKRRAVIEAYKRGEIWAICNDNVMSTGTNVPRIDLIVDMAKTKSASRYVQRVGRGTRVIWPSGFDIESVSAEERRAVIAGHVKPNCRYMDFAGNVLEHGPVDMINPKRPTKGEGTAPIKICPSCEEQLHASLRVCWACGHEFEFDDTPKINQHASDAPIISTSEPEQRIVTSREFRHHPGKAGKPDTVKITYWCGYTAINSWLCPEHGGYAGSQAKKYWLDHGGERPFPKTVMEWLERQSELATTKEITVVAAGKYWNVTGCAVGERVAKEEEGRRPWERETWAREMDDDIPF